MRWGSDSRLHWKRANPVFLQGCRIFLPLYRLTTRQNVLLRNRLVLKYEPEIIGFALLKFMNTQSGKVEKNQIEFSPQVENRKD